MRPSPSSLRLRALGLLLVGLLLAVPAPGNIPPASRLLDILGNATHLCDNAGRVVEQYLYDPFGTPTVYDAAGRVRPGGSAYDNRRLFKSSGGYQWLAPAGLYHCRARCYLPQHGRFLQPDPSGQAGGLNLYSYCHNDPVNGIDPSGLAAAYLGPRQFVVADDGWGGTTQATAIFPDDPVSSEQRGVGTYGQGEGGNLGGRAGGGPGGVFFGTYSDPQAEANGTRNFFAGIVGSAVNQAFAQARSGLSQVAGSDPFGILGAAIDAAERGVNTVGNSAANLLGVDPTSQSYHNGEPGGGWLLAAATLPFGGAEAEAAEGTANILYHYTTAEESAFANGLWRETSVTDKLYTNAAQASQELGIPVPNKVIPIQNTGQFVPNRPPIVQPSNRYIGGGTDFINPNRVPPSQILPARPIG